LIPNNYGAAKKRTPQVKLGDLRVDLKFKTNFPSLKRKSTIIFFCLCVFVGTRSVKDYEAKISEGRSRVLETFPEGTSSLGFYEYSKKTYSIHFHNFSSDFRLALAYTMKSQFCSMLLFSVPRVIHVFESYCAISLPYGDVARNQLEFTITSVRPLLLVLQTVQFFSRQLNHVQFNFSHFP